MHAYFFFEKSTKVKHEENKKGAKQTKVSENKYLYFKYFRIVLLWLLDCEYILSQLVFAS